MRPGRPLPAPSSKTVLLSMSNDFLFSSIYLEMDFAPFHKWWPFGYDSIRSVRFSFSLNFVKGIVTVWNYSMILHDQNLTHSGLCPTSRRSSD